MLRTPDRDAHGRGSLTLGARELVVTLLLAFGSGVTAQDASGQWGPYRGGEPLPGAVAGVDAINALWDHRIVGSTLKPRVNNVTYATGGSGGCVYVSAGSASTVWNTPVIVPDGANVQYLRIYVNDTSASDIQGWLTVYDLYGALVQEFGVNSSGTPGTAYFDSTVINHVIDYSTYSYVINMRPSGIGATLQFCGARVFFDPPPLIFKNGFES